MTVRGYDTAVVFSRNKSALIEAEHPATVLKGLRFIEDFRLVYLRGELAPYYILHFNANADINMIRLRLDIEFITKL